MKNSITRLRAIGFLEGLSFLLLLLVAMPLKYVWGRPEMVSMVGSAHGLLFLLYVAALANAAVERRWPIRKVALGFIASVLPGGPFVFDSRVLREEQAEEAAAALRTA